MAAHAEPEIGKKCPLPLVLVLTFCAHLVNSVAQVGVKSGLNPIFERLSKLYFLSDPKCIAATMATNYPAFSEGRIHEVVEAKVLRHTRS